MTGYKSPDILITPLDENVISVNVYDTPDNTEVFLNNADLCSLVISGSAVSNIGFNPFADETVGYKVPTFLDDYYDRIHILPNPVELGAVLSDIDEDVMVWNSFFEDKTCTAISEIGAEELTLDGLTAPFTLGALAYTIYTVSIPADGSPQIEAYYTFDYGADGSPVLIITGSRITLFSWRPQASPESPLVETLEALTDIITPKMGISAEQRIALRASLRQGFKFALFLLTEKEKATLDVAMFKWQKRMWGVPVWTEMVLHTAAITASETTITVDTTNADFRDDSLAVIWQASDNYEVVKIETVAANLLTLSAPIIGNFTGRKLIMPVRKAYMPDVETNKNLASGVSKPEVMFMVKDNMLISGYSATVTYNGIPVITEATAVDPTQDESSDADVQMNDPGTGDFEMFSDSEFNINSKSHLFYNDTKAECWNFRKFLHYLNGRQKTVWIPTHKEDMILTDTLGAAETTFTIENIGLAKNMGLNDIKTHIAFIFPDGTQIYREITGITDGAEEIISIDSGPGVEINPGDCKISFLELRRLSADSIEIKWPGAHENECQANFTAVVE